ncbi:MAG: UDP-N-acetylmuramoyl-L-alanine--D-glutamate ligase [Actinomycetota bacterium]
MRRLGAGVPPTKGLAGKRVLVVGLGVSGFAAARALAGLDSKVRVTEGGESAAIAERARVLRSEGIEVETGGHDLGRLDADLAVISPGIAPIAAVARALRAEGIETIGEIELAWRLGRCDFLAITGTNGKTTTTSLLAAMLQEAGVPSAAAGNIGLPLIEAVFAIPEGGVIAVEASSFQLATIVRFRPEVAVLLNVAEDHTDWHGTFFDYAAAKARIVENQEATDTFVFNVEDARAVEVAGAARSRLVPFSARRAVEHGIGVEGGHIVFGGTRLIAAEDVPLRGEAGLEDTVAACGAAMAYGIDAQSLVRAIKSFRPPAHRLEVVAELAGVTYVDDSKATNPHATVAATRGLSDVVLIAGGRSKGIDLSSMAATVPPVIAVIALGEAQDEIAKVFSDLVPVERAHTMDEAVALARKLAVRGGSVLMSPGCASLDMYESYVQRGEDFARAVRSVLGEE